MEQPIIIKLITYVSTNFLFIHKATRFDTSVGHLQAYIADQVTGVVCTLGSQCGHSTNDLVCYVGLKMTD